MPKKRIDKLWLYSADDFYGVCIWESIFHQRIHKRQNQSLMINRILALKKNGNNRGFFRDIVNTVLGYFSCECFAVIPGSRKGKSNLQKALGCGVFSRIKDVESRKYDHKDFDKKNSGTVIVNKNNLCGRLLLVDDVITTGKTMNYFSSMLPGYNIIKFAFAINWKLKPEIIDIIDLRKTPRRKYTPLKEIGIEIADLELEDFDFSDY